MKKSASAICILAIITLAMSCKQPGEDWSGMIELIDGVTIIHNPREPIYGEGACSIKEELTIGTADGPEEYMLTSIMDMAVDDEGNIYVADMKGNYVRVFDKEGKYVRTIGGGRGQGPGEFMMLRGIQLTHDRKLRALDRMTVTLSDFTLDGKFIDSRLIKGIAGTILSISYDSRGRNYVESLTMNENSQMELGIDVYDSEFTHFKNIASKEVFQGPVQPFLTWRLSHDQHVVWGDNETYEINVVDSDFKLVRKITREHDPIPTRREEVENRLGRPLKPTDELPKYYPAYGHISVDDEGRIYVQTWETTETYGYYYDVFDLEGRYITRFIFKYQVKPIWKNGRVYTKESDEDGLPLVKCYSVAWNY